MSSALRTLSVKLAAVLFAVVAGALAIVYLAVVPQLESRLVAAKIRELERDAPAVIRDLRGRSPLLYHERVDLHAAALAVRVVVFERLNARTLIPVADSSGLRSGDVQRDPTALRGAETRLRSSGRVERDGRAYAEVAAPVDRDTVVLLSAPLADALANVGLVRRSVLVAGLIALLVSAFAGYAAAWGFTRRLRRLEAAAERIAGGDFEVPVVDRGRDEVAQLARAFESMRVRLRHLDRARREFIANASHELRTPLFSLGGFLELLADEDLDDATRREFLAETRTQVERLTRLATDLLDLTRLDAGQLDVRTTRVDLAASARAVAAELRALAEAKTAKLQISVSADAHALADEQRVLQIARILVENAVRHTPVGTRIDVAVGARNGRVFLSVRDDGPGIEAADQAHVFERFYRGRGGQAAGSGLGLAIASELAARMEGSLELTSGPGETTFTLVLPPAPEPPPFSRENGVTLGRDRGGARLPAG